MDGEIVGSEEFDGTGLVQNIQVSSVKPTAQLRHTMHETPQSTKILAISYQDHTLSGFISQEGMQSF